MSTLDKTHTVGVTFRLPQQRLRDILTTAFEQGIGYWLDDAKVTSVDALRDVNGYVHTLVFNFKNKSAADEVLSRVRSTRNKALLTDVDFAAALGEALMNDDARRAAVCEIAERDFDAHTADALVQFAMFGKVVYG